MKQWTISSELQADASAARIARAAAEAREVVWGGIA
jgi:hypothetical protein